MSVCSRCLAYILGQLPAQGSVRQPGCCDASKHGHAIQCICPPTGSCAFLSSATSVCDNNGYGGSFLFGIQTAAKRYASAPVLQWFRDNLSESDLASIPNKDNHLNAFLGTNSSSITAEQLSERLFFSENIMLTGIRTITLEDDWDKQTVFEHGLDIDAIVITAANALASDQVLDFLTGFYSHIFSTFTCDDFPQGHDFNSVKPAYGLFTLLRLLSIYGPTLASKLHLVSYFARHWHVFGLTDTSVFDPCKYFDDIEQMGLGRICRFAMWTIPGQLPVNDTVFPHCSQSDLDTLWCDSSYETVAMDASIFT